jgi:hypothetical protein
LKNNFKIFYIYIITDTEVYTTKHVTINKGWHIKGMSLGRGTQKYIHDVEKRFWTGPNMTLPQVTKLQSCYDNIID